MSKKVNPNNLKAADIRKAMSKRWTAPEWAIMWEVANCTGFGASRSADAVMMSLWPSRGLELHGVEIKVSRSDWKREAKDPSKAESIAKYCDRWWIHTPVGVVDDLSDLPPAWGLREFSGRQWKTIREAEKTDAEQTDRGFLAALLRRSDESLSAMAREAIKDERAEIQKTLERERLKIGNEIDKMVERRSHDYAGIKEKVKQFEDITGVEIDRYGDDLSNIGRCAAFLSRATKSDYLSIERHADRLEEAAKALRELHEISKPSDGLVHELRSASS